MRRALITAVLLIAAVAASAADVTFVSPQRGAQAIGLMLIEIDVDVENIDRIDFHVDGVLAGAARTPPYRIAYDFGTSLEARTIAAKIWSDGFTKSQTATITTAPLSANETLNIDIVEVPLRVRSSRTIRASDLRIRENGIEQTVRDVKNERPAAHFAFIVDRSLSMDGGKLDAALAAVEAELAQLRPGDTASLILFNHHVAKPRAIRRGDDLRRIASDTVPSGGTSLRDALASIASGERTYGIAITDGGDRNSELSDEEALRKISGTKTVVNAVVMGGSHARFLDRAARNTGGSVVTATASSVRNALAGLLTDINSRYLVIYQSHGTQRGWRTVDVKPRRRGIAIVSARRGYFAEP